MLIREGQTIRDTYEVERFLGEGAFAEVYRVRHRFLGRQALKVLKTVGMTVVEIEEMLGEAALLSRLGHPNIVRVFDANVAKTSRGTCGFFTMEYVAGGSLESFWRSHGAKLVPVEVSVDIMTQVCRGMAVAHGESPPIVHRDLKPQNILVGYDSAGIRARVSDFGLARRVNPLTLLASGRGTRCFKAPEVFADYRTDSCAGDVWALGCTLYLLLTDRLPYADLDALEAFSARCFEQPVIPPSRLNVRVDPHLDQIAYRALALEPEKRYATATELLRDLESWVPQLRSGRREPKREALTGSSKSVLGACSPADQNRAMQMVREALDLAHAGARLQEAADLMEEALNKWPNLRAQYEYQLKTWRRGISM